ncbi:MAG: ABC transporter ATP-binding protein, partial [Ureaplasma sp.]|nr:ABC transporter ATP-binding protein [Ureaplasma sp.]
NKTETEKEIILTKRWFRYKTPIDKKLDKLNDKYNDLDYWVSYWETYPDIKKEEFEKRNITRRLNKEEIDEKFKKVISLVGLQGKENSYPSDLSGGMQQRVALARSIVIEPEIILLDEPLSALDAKVRQQLQAELKRLHKELGITFILVTHDQEEALMLSDKIVVMSEGKIEQIGTPEEIYDTPKNLWVAKFIGKTNIYKTEDKENKKVIFCDYKFNLEIKEDENKEAYFLIRPEDFNIVENNQGMINDVFVKSVNYSGLFYDLECISHNNKTISIKSITFIKPESKIGLNINQDNIHIIYEEIEKDENNK